MKPIDTPARDTSALPEPAPMDPVQPDPAPAEPAPPARCKNCGAVLLGRFCVNCSQAADVHVPSTVELVHEMLEGLTHSDSRLWRTLRLLWFKPGRLTEEFVAGRRVAYLPPFRLYLILSIALFLIASFTPSGQLVQFEDPKAPPAASDGSPITSCQDIPSTKYPELNRRLRHACEESVRDNGKALWPVVVHTAPKAMFIFLPLIAFLHMLLYWRPRYRYAEHLLFFIHLHALYFSAAILSICAILAAGSWSKMSGVSDFLQTVLRWYLVIYTLFAMRRVFRRSWAGTLLKAVVLFFVYSIFLALTFAGVIVYAALQL
jgi:YD repeat-containing protein